MGHFTIMLPDKRLGDVRWGKVFKKFQIPILPLFKKSKGEVRGYIIKVDPAVDGRVEYRLFQSQDGKWSKDPDGMTEVDDEMSQAIKQAIEQHEQSNK